MWVGSCLWITQIWSPLIQTRKCWCLDLLWISGCLLHYKPTQERSKETQYLCYGHLLIALSAGCFDSRCDTEFVSALQPSQDHRSQQRERIVAVCWPNYTWMNCSHRYLQLFRAKLRWVLVRVRAKVSLEGSVCFVLMQFSWLLHPEALKSWTGAASTKGESQLSDEWNVFFRTKVVDQHMWS